MKVLHLVLKPRFSGAEILVRDLAIAHSSQGLKVGIASFQPPDDDFIPVIENLSSLGVILFLPKRPLKKFSRVIGLWNFAEKFSPDIIVAHSVIPTIYARIAFFNKRIPKIISVLHAVDDFRAWKLRLPEYILSRRSDKVVAVSNETAQNYVKKFPKIKVDVIQNGINTRKFVIAVENRAKYRERFGLSDSNIIVLQVGRIATVKQQHLSLEAMLPIMRNNQDVELWFVGPVEEKSYYDYLLDKIKSYDIRNRVRFWGGQDNLEEFFSVSDLFLMPSIREASGIAFLEALASGVPVIASDIPPFAFAKEYPGVWLVSPEDVGDFSSRIQQVLDEKKRYKRDLSLYDFKHTSDQYLSLFKEVHVNAKGCSN
ncbi:MAG: glycosyltransferase family 4 protein [Brockia lithotrophica]|nr:glycosyltransferase family 4 protein [Brockia lithotrophica]